jgi:FkbM family methyltransferase
MIEAKVIEWAATLVTPPEFTFLPYGLWSEDTTMRFYAPARESDASFSIDNIQGTTDYFEGDCRTVESIMAMCGHTRLDLIKLDIEGAEGPVVDAMLASEIRPTVIAVEFDLPEFPWKTRARIRRICDAGYDVASVEDRNYVFVHR